MFIKSILAICLLAYCASASDIDIDMDPVIAQHQYAMRIMIRSLSGNMNRDLPTADQCFDYYLDQENAIYNEYSRTYRGCSTTASDAKKALSDENAEKRDSMITQSKAVCSGLESCYDVTDGLAFFTCMKDTSSKSVSTVWGLETDSSNQVQYLEIQYQKIDNDQKVCSTAARNKYIGDMATCNTDLDSCLAGGSTLPTTAAPADSTTRPQPTIEDTTTTSLPVETTPEPTTEETTTVAPVETTSEPITEETTTVAPVETTPEATTPEPQTSGTPDSMPEEDVRFRPMSRMRMWNVLRKV
ncbi:uncharacterized protein LOC119677678 [Teleopsis dalmanni]|uniref:uncharacterized protein LOC119677678 n=1 Tax=Teleopsis dalmanni TaxID=139649 RepID=UPI0018CD679B|nr:uncharacterized protein LOC119677678 [Teleopsis dalmanni]